jgi:multiple sugar transport system permease protein
MIMSKKSRLSFNRPSFSSRVVLVLMVFIWVVPTYWLLMTAFKSQNDAIAAIPTWWPSTITLENFSRILGEDQTPVFRWFWNSIKAATLHTLLVLLVATPAAYALARFDFKFKKAITGIVLASLFIPGIALFVPNYVTISRLGWIDDLAAIVVPGAASALAVFFLRQFFVSFPKEIDEAAILDGCTRWQVFKLIALPLSKPAIATIGTLVFLGNWNDFLWPLYVLISPENLTLQPGLQTLQSAYTTDYATIMTGAAIASVPVLLIYIFAQKYIIEGVTRSGIKG